MGRDDQHSVIDNTKRCITLLLSIPAPTNSVIEHHMTCGNPEIIPIMLHLDHESPISCTRMLRIANQCIRSGPRIPLRLLLIAGQSFAPQGRG